MAKLIVNLILIVAVVVLFLALTASAGRRRRTDRSDHAEERRLILAAFTNAVATSASQDAETHRAAAIPEFAGNGAPAVPEWPMPTLLFNPASVAALLDMLENRRPVRRGVLTSMVLSPRSVWTAEHAPAVTSTSDGDNSRRHPVKCTGRVTVTLDRRRKVVASSSEEAFDNQHRYVASTIPEVWAVARVHLSHPRRRHPRPNARPTGPGEALIRYLRTVMGRPTAWDLEGTIRRAIAIRDGVVQDPKILSFQGRSSERPHARL